jgi:pyridoxine/pyridoxamine 5'-phosphate oxidase
VTTNDARTIADIRKEYALAGLDESHLDPDPIRQFARWLGEAAAAGVPEHTAMTLATAGADGRPSARVVLLKGFDERGFVFYSNYGSLKGRHLAENPHASLSSSGPSWSGRSGSRASPSASRGRHRRPTSTAARSAAGWEPA